MAEYINRKALLRYIEDTNTVREWLVSQYNADWIYSFIESAPTADVAEVKRAFFITNCYGDSRCSACGKKRINITYRYCPNCGAKMYGGEK